FAVNHAALRQYGYSTEEFMSMTARDLVPAGGATAFFQEVARPCSGAESRGIWRHCRKDLTEIEVEVTTMDLKFAGYPARLVVANDFTQRRRQERELRQTEKTETIARLAGGFAHHFNNILTIIDCQASLLLNSPQNPKTTEQLTHISTAANRAA